MKKTLILLVIVKMTMVSYSQPDTISQNIYQNNGKLGIGTENPISLIDMQGQLLGDDRYIMRLSNTDQSNSSFCSLRITSGSEGHVLTLGYYSDSYTGTAGAAGFGILNSTNKGLMLNATDFGANGAGPGIIKFCSGIDVTGHIERMRLDQTGNLGIGTQNPAEKLDINGGLRLGYTNNTNLGTIRWTGSDFEGYNGLNWVSFTNGSGAEYWNLNGSDLYYTNGKVGIGTDSPENALSIVGNEDEWPGRIFLSVKNTSSSNKSLAYIKIQAGPTTSGTSLGHISSTYTSAGSYEEIADYGRLTSSGNGLMIDATKPDMSPGIIKFCSGQNAETAFIERMRIDANGNIGIGTSEPNALLNIKADVPSGDERALIRLRNTSVANTSSVSLALEANDGLNGAAFTLTSGQFSTIPDFDRMGVISVNGKGFSIYSTSDYGSIRFYTNMNENGIIERMRINAEGYVGIGTSSPFAKLQVTDGDIYISDINRGIIMKSPNGQCWRGTISNSGNLNFTPVECPEVPVNIEVNKEANDPSLVQIFPNPAKHAVSIVMKNNAETKFLKIYSSSGTLIESKLLSSEKTEIDITGFRPGLYLFTIEDNKEHVIASEKVIKE
jgi:hypothetical protein